MTTHVALLQARGVQPSWPTGPVTPLTPTPGTPTPGTPTPATPGVPTGTPATGTPTPGQVTNVTVITNATTGDLSQDLCEMASRNMLIAAGGYVFGATLLGMLVFLVMRKKLWSTVFGRYLTAVLLAAVTAALLMYFDPARADDLVRCLNSPDFARYVVLGSGQAARAMVLGLVPAFVLTTVGCLVANRT